MKMKRVCSLGWESPEILLWLEPGSNHKIWLCCEWIKIACLTTKHQIDIFILPLLLWKPIHVLIIHSLSPFQSSWVLSLHYPTAPTFYMPRCSMRHRETIWGEIMLSWALALWNATKNRGWFAAAELLPTKYFIAWLHISGFSPFTTLTTFFSLFF